MALRLTRRQLVVGSAAVTAFGLLLLRPGKTGSGFTYGGDSTSRLNRDPESLLPGFAQNVEILFRRMRRRGYSPRLWEGRRTAARAAQLARKGTGIKLSMHILGAAVDVVDGDSSSPFQVWAPGFWDALGEEAEGMGLTWGGRWANGDRPHVQAITVGEQVAFRQMSVSEREDLVA